MIYSIINITNSPTLGNPDAFITIIDFSDFQCFMCAKIPINTEPVINETYIQTGKAKLVFKHFPIRGFGFYRRFYHSSMYK